MQDIILEISNELSIIPIEIWYLIIILGVIQIGLMVFALYDWLKKENKDMPNRKTWLLLILFVNIFGPITYFWIAPRNSGSKLVFDDDEDDSENPELYEFKG